MAITVIVIVVVFFPLYALLILNTFSLPSPFNYVEKISMYLLSSMICKNNSRGFYDVTSPDLLTPNLITIEFIK